MNMTITPIYAGLITLLLIGLSVRVIARRRSACVSIGDGNDPELNKRIRVQANCTEYAPLGILLLAMTELQGAPDWVTHLLGLMILSGRILHAIGLGSTPQILPLRQIGMVLTYLMLILAAVSNIGHALI